MYISDKYPNLMNWPICSFWGRCEWAIKVRMEYLYENTQYVQMIFWQNLDKFPWKIYRSRSVV